MNIKTFKIILVIFAFMSAVYVNGEEFQTDTGLWESKSLYSDLSDDDRPSFRLNISFMSMPVGYDAITDFQSYDFNGDIMAGARYKNLTIGVGAGLSYTMMSKYDTSIDTILGAFFSLRFTSIVMYQPIYWLEFRVGTGVTWLASAFDRNTGGAVPENRLGFALSTGVTFRPFRIVSFEIPVSLDLYFNGLKSYPFFAISGRVNFHPLLEWINISTEIGLFVWSDDNYYESFNTVLFVWRVGCGFEIDVNRTAANMRRLKQQITDQRVVDFDNSNRLKMLLWQLRYARENQQIAFDSITFEPDSAELKESAFVVLDQIAEVLKERTNVFVEIGGYTNATGNESEELILSVQRAQSVALYLFGKGVLYAQIKVAGYGAKDINNRPADSTIDNRKVVIKIISIFQE